MSRICLQSLAGGADPMPRHRSARNGTRTGKNPILRHAEPERARWPRTAARPAPLARPRRAMCRPAGGPWGPGGWARANGGALGAGRREPGAAVEKRWILPPLCRAPAQQGRGWPQPFQYPGRSGRRAPTQGPALQWVAMGLTKALPHGHPSPAALAWRSAAGLRETGPRPAGPATRAACTSWGPEPPEPERRLRCACAPGA
jgi:hypothetical protein